MPIALRDFSLQHDVRLFFDFFSNKDKRSRPRITADPIKTEHVHVRVIGCTMNEEYDYAAAV